jgi:hypothetical protein
MSKKKENDRRGQLIILPTQIDSSSNDRGDWRAE